MLANKRHIYAVPTNIITGFLGVGKTTLILNLLTQKPASERWAVLVNEFGEVGIDGSLLKGTHDESQGVFIREVPGGCMCCAAGLPMQMALNMLLARAKPDRLLIEPTGLGHPKEVLELLSTDYYRDVLDIQRSLTLVDARKLSDIRYTENATFNQQIDIADMVIGHKVDLYDNEARQNLIEYVTKRRGQSVPVGFVQQGEINIDLLSGKSNVAAHISEYQHKRSNTSVLAPREQTLPESGYLKIENAGEGHQSVGWRFSSEHIFKRSALFSWLKSLNVERAKGVFITNEGVFSYNLTSDALTEMVLDDCIESRIEIIARDKNDIQESHLLDCIER